MTQTQMNIEMTNSIHPDTSVSAVHLVVADLESQLSFYRDKLGLKVHHQENGTASLGAGEADFLFLTQRPAVRPPRRATGLYHFAILTPSRLQLARSLRQLAETSTPVEGFADHLVSEAIYLSDPEGNGIEIYRDRPRDQWPRRDGQVVMASDPLDLDGILAELESDREPWTGLHPETRLGHMHLKVADIVEAEAFYCGVLGFDLIARLASSALFVSAGGYHHHIGMNTWESAGAAPPPSGSTGLAHFVIELPDATELSRTADRMRGANWKFSEREGGLFVRDPSENGLLLATRDQAT